MSQAHHPNCLCAKRGFLSAFGPEALYAATSGVTVGKLRALALPDTAAAAAAEHYLYAISSPAMIRHCKRTYLFGKALAEKAGTKVDLEALYIGCLFHDLGLEPIFEGLEDFEDIGAREASRFLKARGYDDLAGQVAAAIKIHTYPTTENDPCPEIAYLHIGALVDVLGRRVDQIDAKLLQQVVEEYPREGTKLLLTTLLGREINTKPNSHFGQMAARVDILGLINAAPFDG
jgi:hypothetical protein